jgi:DNA-binding transcriptional MocR family regulator
MDTNWRPALPHGHGPRYRALAEQIVDAVSRGDIAAGARLPPVRDLAWELKVSPGAVARAYRIAIDRGALEATVGRGTFARGPDSPPTGLDALLEARPGGKIDLRGNQAADVGQDAELTAALQRVIERHAHSGLPLTRYTRHEETPEIHGALADWLRAGGVPAAPGRLLLTNGAQQGVMACLGALAQGGQGVALVEPNVHPGLRECAEAAGVRLEPVAADAEGMIPEALDAAARRLRPDAVLLTATFNNPTLSLMGDARRAALAETLRRRDLQVIEDDVYGWLIAPRPAGFASLCPERCWYVTSLSKCVAAGLRLGFVIAPERAMARLLRAHTAIAHHVSWLTMALGAELAASGDAERIRRRVQAEVAARAALAEAALGPHGARTHPAASFALLPMPAGWSSADFAAAAAAEDVLTAPRAVYGVTRGAAAGADYVRVALGARESRARIEEGLRRLARLLRDGPGLGPLPT